MIQPTADSFEFLKKEFDELNIFLLERNQKEFSKIIDEITFDENDIEMILKSSSINNIEKNKFLDKCSNEIILSNVENLKLISELLLEDDLFKTNEVIFKSLITSNSISINNRIKLFNKNLFSVDEIFIENFLKALSNRYEKITDKSKKAKIVDNPDNRELLNILKNKNYISSFSEGLFGLSVNHKRN